MPTNITLHIGSPESSHSWQLELADDFETVFNKLFPAQPPASQLEHQQNMRHTLVDGRSVAIQPQAIVVVEEAEA